MEFTLDYLLKKCNNKEYIELLEFLGSECKNIETSMLKSNDKVYKEELKSYLNYVKGFLFFLNTGGVPYSIEKSDFALFKPIILHLVELGNLKPTVLESF